MDAPPHGVLLTGATGFVGKEVLRRYLELTDRPVYAVVRAADDAAAAERLGAADAIADGRLVAVAGDIERPRLGLDPARYEWLAERVSDIVHAAASVSFTLGLEESRRINVDGTRNVLDFAARAPALRCMSYVSTAFVGGTHRGAFTERDLDLGQGFRNAYERSKFEAERLVRSYAGRLPLQVLRPSIIVGDRATGWTAAFNVVYGPLKAFAKGGFYALPARTKAPVDVVPIDYVADAVFQLSAAPEPGETYHLVAGGRASTVGRLIRISAGYFERRAPATLPPALYRRLVHPLLLRATRGRRRRALEQTEVFFPYFSMGVRYDDARARSRLEPLGIRVTPVEDYFNRLADFAVASDWGRRPAPRHRREPVAH